MLTQRAIFETEITDYTADGRGVAHIAGCAVFIPNAIVGERCRVRIVHAGKTSAVGKIEEIRVQSPHRVAPDCPYGRQCGGCDFRHMDYAEEKRLKAQRVTDALRRLAGWEPDELPLTGAERRTGYRNKALFPVSAAQGRAEAGFYQSHTHRVVPVAACLLQNEAANAARTAVVEYLRAFRVSVYDEQLHKGLVRHIYVRTADATGQVMVCLLINGGRLPHERELCALLQKAVPGLASVVIGENTKQGNSVMGDRYRTLWGADTIEDVLCGLRFTLSPGSFYQVNRAQAERLYEKAAEFAALQKTDTVLDLYCGTGTITLHLARQAGKAIGVELVPAAIADAKQNARTNGIRNAEFFCADAGQAAARLLSEGERPTVVVVDPPRKGLSAEVIPVIAQMAPQRVVYVSCDPATLSRDIAIFKQNGYQPQKAAAVDLFPGCAHVESVVLMTRRKG